MTLLSLESTLNEENRSADGVLFTISQALRDLVSSLQGFREVEAMLGSSSVSNQAGYYLTNDGSTKTSLGVVAGTLREMVGKLVSDTEAKPEIQKLLLVIQKSTSGAVCKSTTLADQQGLSGVVGMATSREEEACTSGLHARKVKRSSTWGCGHICAVHAEVMDPYLWSKLPVELVELVLGSQSIGKVLELCSYSVCSSVTRSLNFKRICYDSHPGVIGQLVGMGRSCTELRNAVYDNQLKKWVNHDLVGFRQTFDMTAHKLPMYIQNSKYACDGGLVCFVPRGRMLSSSSILIGNPLTDEWKVLPCLPHLPFEDGAVTLVQLVVDKDTKCYKVILVFCDKKGETFVARWYNSETSEWSTMESGLVYGDTQSFLKNNQGFDLRVFNCETKMMYKLVDRTTRPSSLKTRDKTYRIFDPPYEVHRDPINPGLNARRCAIVNDGRVFVLHECSSNPDYFHYNRASKYPYALRCHVKYKISEYAWQSNTSDLKFIKSSEPRSFPVNDPFIFFATSEGFIFMLVDKGNVKEHQHELMNRLYDSSDNRWWRLPDMANDIRDEVTSSRLRYFFWCELRWDAIP